jgi:hypothetical protein
VARYVPPRIFGIVATHAPVAAVIRRGPTEWAHLSKWDLATGALERGGWLHARVFPQRCDLSPDGRWLAYLAHRAGWPGDEVYDAISHLPWWTALAAWDEGTTYAQGLRFVDDPAAHALREPDVGTVVTLLERYGLVHRRPRQFAVELDRGWVESDDSPPREAGGPWDENRSVTVSRARPGSPATALRAAGRFAAFRDNRPYDPTTTYELETDGEVVALDVQWADWDHRGRLLLATTAGSLRIHEPDGGHLGPPLVEHDLVPLVPDPQPPPASATRW